MKTTRTTRTTRDWLSTSEVAAILGVSTGRVRQFVAERRLAGQKAGLFHLFQRAEVERFAAIPRRDGPLSQFSQKNDNRP